VIVGHVMGVPIEESLLQLAPAGAAIATMVAFLGREAIERTARRLRHKPHEGRSYRPAPPPG
jgi:hypothetical protein